LKKSSIISAYNDENICDVLERFNVHVIRDLRVTGIHKALLITPKGGDSMAKAAKKAAKKAAPKKAAKKAAPKKAAKKTAKKK